MRHPADGLDDARRGVAAGGRPPVLRGQQQGAAGVMVQRPFLVGGGISLPHRRHRSGKWLSLRAENTFGADHARVGQPYQVRLQRGLRALEYKG